MLAVITEHAGCHYWTCWLSLLNMLTLSIEHADSLYNSHTVKLDETAYVKVIEYFSNHIFSIHNRVYLLLEKLS